ncbi:MAG: glutamate synthase large subunit [Sedimentisphaerales bacterium]|nr:glutamate synthase large subunit [Sedimentisphaerales bacterium]MBN2843762.1 glutamate synthase large subunit [Sedimentisphaerales bacterium]
MRQQPQEFGLYNSRNEHDACGTGAVCNISGKRDHNIIEIGSEILLNIQHRGAAGSDGLTGDGAGILFQIPHEFFVEEAGFELPERGGYAVAMVFGSKDNALRHRCDKKLEENVAKYGMKVLGWREVKGNSSCLGEIARSAEPSIRQMFIDGCGLTGDALERKLFIVRRATELAVEKALGKEAEDFYITSMSSRTICYKGMFLAPQLFEYYTELHDERMVSALALVHQRYSTNTFPNWRLAHPFRCIAHNGEINTLSGNYNRMRAREHRLESELLGESLKDIKPILTAGHSDSATFDNALELLVMSGRSMPHAMMMMIPEAFGPRYHISTDKRAFYEFHSSIMEPWDGPAAMVFTDGRVVGGTLDRNGLRPCRYVVTTDGIMVLGSEAGVKVFPDEQVQRKGRLQPGKMFLVDTEAGRIITDNEIKSKISRQKPYRRWLDENRIELEGMFQPKKLGNACPEETTRLLKGFGYTREELNVLLKPMAVDGQEPVGSMGTDTPLAVLSNKSKNMFYYFKQLFAQVTNPPIDPLREGMVMSLMSYIGKQRNLLTESPDYCRQLKIPHPIMTNEDIEVLRKLDREDFKVATIDAVFDARATEPGKALKVGMDKLIDDAVKAIDNGASLIIVSDRAFGPEKAAIPSLLATAGLHHGLLNRGLRGEAALVIETGDAREVHHFCLLCGFGANAVNPYLALEAINMMRQQGDIPATIEESTLTDHYVVSIKKGILKTISKMGISTLRSYHAAQLFECVGINRDVVDAYFTGTASRIQGIGLNEIAREALMRHTEAWGQQEPGKMDLEHGGEYSYRKNGEQHLLSPEAIALVHQAVRNNDYSIFKRYTKVIDDQSGRRCTLRGLFDFVPGTPVPLSEVEPASEIVKRFCTGAMSHGSISKEAHEAMAIAMNRIGARSNTGEGGEDPARYQLDVNGDDRACKIKQVASGRFGVTMDYLSRAEMLQIKMAQGAKPGEGGQLPGHKVSEEIARLRYSTPGVTLISPPPHHDIYSIEDLAQLIYDLKCASNGAQVSVKLVSEVGVGTVAAGVAKGNADEVLIAGFDGGTGASPLSSIKHAGLPWELGLAETQQTLVLNGLRDRIIVQADGQMKTGRDVVIAALLGAERFGFGTMAIVSLGCVMMRKCHLGTCPVGVATQTECLRKKFMGDPQHLVNFMLFIAEEVRELMAKLGFRKFNDMVGQVQYLAREKAINHWKAEGLDFSAIFAVPEVAKGETLYCSKKQENPLTNSFDWQLIEKSKPAIEKQEKTVIELETKNIYRTVGTILSNHIVKKHGAGGLPDNTLEIKLRGSSGQSFGAWLCPGVTLNLTGDANDYLGKGLSGGRIVVKKPEACPFEAQHNIIAGNTLLYGATSGEVFINGLAGERFAVRNSGATAVVEGVGDHGCEYMTNGTVVVLGTTGRNFAAGMSGGIAYVYDEYQLFDTLCNLDMVDLESVWQDEDKAILQSLVLKHYQWTNSAQAKRLLDNWDGAVGMFVKVMPIDYRKAMQRMKEKESRATDQTPATEEVYK